MKGEHESISGRALLTKRGLSYAEAINYVGVKRRTFEAKWRPRLVAMNQGTCVIFDREELDRLFEQFKLESAAEGPTSKSAEPNTAQNRAWNGRPITVKGVQSWAETQGVSTPQRTEPGRSTAVEKHPTSPAWLRQF